MQRLKNIYHLFQAILAVFYYRYPARKLVVIGVTGTDGKTTTASLIGHILNQAHIKTGLMTTLGAKIGGASTEIGLHVTTPSPFVLQKLLRQMVNANCSHAVVEATSHGLDQNRLVGCHFSYGVLTNITHEHLDYHKTMRRYARAKAKLFFNVKAAVINIDGPWFDLIKPLLRAKRIVTYGLTASAQINLATFPFTTQLPGEYNKANVLGAVAIAKLLNVPDIVIREAVATFAGVTGRLEPVEAGQPYRVIVDFAHTPNAIDQVLKTLLEQTMGRLIVVFGSAGLRDQTKRPISGKVVGTLATIAIITADDPATEDVNKIIDQISIGTTSAGAKEVAFDQILTTPVKTGDHVFTRQSDRKNAIRLAIRLAQAHDTVALLGKGHQKSLSIGKEELPWDEHTIAREALGEVGFYGT